MAQEEIPVPDGAAAAQADAVVEAEHDRELIREAVAMALYVSISLLAVLVALPSEIEGAGRVSIAIGIAVTALGLMAAHWLAFRLSTRLTYGELARAEHGAVFTVQVVAAATVVGAAAIPVLLFGPTTGLVVAQLVLLGIVAVVAYLAARPGDVGRTRALIDAFLVVAAAGIVVGIKNLVGH
jgi:hypothetical protein